MKLQTYEVAERHVAGYVSIPVLDWHDIEALERLSIVTDAELLFTQQPLHQCYWNNRFCIATMCQLNEERQRQAAWCLVSNGLNRYWEWVTHGGYRMYHVLDCLEIINLNDLNGAKVSIRNERHERLHGVKWKSLHPGYSYAPIPLLEEIAQRFSLPTTYFDNSRKLTNEEIGERKAFNNLYPHTKVL